MTFDITPKKASMDSTLSDDKMKSTLVKNMFDLMFNEIAAIKTEHRQDFAKLKQQIITLTRHMKANKQEIAANKTSTSKRLPQTEPSTSRRFAEQKQEIIAIRQKLEAMDTKLTSMDTKLRLILLNTTVGEFVDRLDKSPWTIFEPIIPSFMWRSPNGKSLHGRTKTILKIKLFKVSEVEGFRNTEETPFQDCTNTTPLPLSLVQNVSLELQTLKESRNKQSHAPRKNIV
jgi:uncharacterized coiled-coil protein SlyX